MVLQQFLPLKGDGIEALRDDLEGKVNLFTGHSGVGKSALINHLQPALDVRTGEISNYHNKGMHTITFARCSFLRMEVISDTPGIKKEVQTGSF